MCCVGIMPENSDDRIRIAQEWTDFLGILSADGAQLEVTIFEASGFIC